MLGEKRIERRRRLVTLGAAMLLLGFCDSLAAAAEKGMADKGRALVEEHCARCHAIGLEGDSSHADAPPFRTLSRKYPVEDLAESLAEGIVSGHPDMPIFVFKPTDVQAIIEYLQSIQEEPAPPGEPAEE